MLQLLKIELIIMKFLPSNQLELGLWIESERLLHAKIDTVGVETQRKVVKGRKKTKL